MKNRMHNWLLAIVLFFPACDLDYFDDDALFAGCAIVGTCLLLYAFKCFAMSGDEMELES